MKAESGKCSNLNRRFVNIAPNMRRVVSSPSFGAAAPLLRPDTGRVGMKVKIAMGAFVFFMIIGAAGLLAARDTQKTTHKKTRTLTGCLQKADDAKEYNLTTKNGGTWEIKSDSVKLAPHVGHTMTITGVVSNATLHGVKEDAKAEAKEHGVDKDSTEHGHMTVTNAKMVSNSCQN